MRYRIKSRLADLGMKSVDLLDELRGVGVFASSAEFSRAINNREHTPKADLICQKADEILCKIEKEKGLR